jgi:hypothetical protein
MHRQTKFLFSIARYNITGRNIMSDSLRPIRQTGAPLAHCDGFIAARMQTNSTMFCTVIALMVSFFFEVLIISSVESERLMDIPVRRDGNREVWECAFYTALHVPSSKLCNDVPWPKISHPTGVWSLQFPVPLILYSQNEKPLSPPKKWWSLSKRRKVCDTPI